MNKFSNERSRHSEWYLFCVSVLRGTQCPHDAGAHSTGADRDELRECGMRQALS